ncbi:hypothetical protein K3495_g7311 [Podosphaera aphanis]|nr:hypothetical protein K3495_g7311 [Podosphaera aphanis]
MVDTGCLCFSIFDERLVRNHILQTEVISPRTLRLADGKATALIDRVATVNMDIDERQEKLWGYVLPNLAYKIILGKPWMEHNDVVYSAKRMCLRIGSRKHGMIVRASGWHEQGSPAQVQERVSCVSIDQVALESEIELAELIKYAQRNKNCVVGAILMNDITRALEPKKAVSREEVQRGLPDEIKSYMELFLDEELSKGSALPPNRPGVDTNIKLKRDDKGRDKDLPWGPLYEISRIKIGYDPVVLRGGAPVLFIRKPQGGLRFCVDYRAMNAITERDRYPLPLIRETLRLVANATWISKIDVRAAFHRLRIAEGDEWKTALSTRFGSCEWLVTPFGLAGAPAAFQRWINQVLGNLQGQTCAAYLDDVIIFSRGDLSDLWIKVCQNFVKKEIKYLGFTVNVEEGLKVDPEKTKAIATWEAPKDIKGVRSFLGFANFYRGFIKQFSDISNPLLNLTEKGIPFYWSNQHQEAFDKLKKCFITAPVLAMWDENLETSVECDSSGWATGGCLSQYDKNGCLRPVAYYSAKLTPVECNYDIHNKELLGIINCLKEWRGELISLQRPFKILTDHNNLKYFMTTQKLTERQVRWSQLLLQYNFEMIFRPGRIGQRPDALSRRD